jgi:hypothetical protein
MVWESQGPFINANPDAVELPLSAILERRVRVAVGAKTRLSFSVVLPIRNDARELETLR